MVMYRVFTLYLSVNGKYEENMKQEKDEWLGVNYTFMIDLSQKCMYYLSTFYEEKYQDNMQ